MTELFSMLLVLAALYFIKIESNWCSFKWVRQCQYFLKSHVEALSDGVIALLVLVIIMAVLMLLNGMVSRGVTSSFILETLVLYYCMAGINARKDAKIYADLMLSDANQASDFMQKTFYPSEDIADIKAERQRNMAIIFQKVTQSLFSVLFFYVLFGYLGGLFGAVFYRLVYHFAHDHEQGDSIQRKAAVVLSLLDWIPFRLLALTLVILSSFERVFPVWLKSILTPPSENNAMLSATGFSALKVMPTETIPGDLFPEKELLSLIDHSLVVWLGLIAIVTLIAAH